MEGENTNSCFANDVIVIGANGALVTRGVTYFIYVYLYQHRSGGKQMLEILVGLISIHTRIALAGVLFFRCQGHAIVYSFSHFWQEKHLEVLEH